METTARLDGVRRNDAPAGQAFGDRVGGLHQEREGEAILHHLGDFLDAFMWQADPATLEFTFITTSVRDVLGHPVSRWLGGPELWSEIVHVEDRSRVIDCLRATASDGLDREVELRAIASDGSTKVFRQAVRLLVPPFGEAELWGVTTDVTEDARATEALRHAEERYQTLSAQTADFRRQALEDALTKLPNRILFDDRLGSALRSAQRTGAPCAVLVMDLDRFKEINDTRGHQTGDAVLREVALRFRICLRGADTPARLGGDEFAAVLPNTDSDGAVRVAERIVRALQTSISLDEGACEVGSSIGIALFPTHGATAQELLARADVAMYRAKAAGGGVAMTEAEQAMPALDEGRRDTYHRLIHRPRRMLIGILAAFGILASAAAPVAMKQAPQGDPAARIDAAAFALKDASSAHLQDVVAGVEQTLGDISWSDVAGTDVLVALGRLERTLDRLRSGVPVGMASRVERLIATIQKAEIVAQLSDGSRITAPITLSPRPGVDATPTLRVDLGSPTETHPPIVLSPTPAPSIAKPQLP